LKKSSQNARQPITNYFVAIHWRNVRCSQKLQDGRTDRHLDDG